MGRALKTPLSARGETRSWHRCIAGREQLFAQPLDPELRALARFASDDKSPIMMNRSVKLDQVRLRLIQQNESLLDYHVTFIAYFIPIRESN